MFFEIIRVDPYDLDISYILMISSIIRVDPYD